MNKHIDKPTLLSVTKIWDQAEHNALTDLIEFQSSLFCCFREGKEHSGKAGDGSVRILKCNDLKTWTSVALLAKEGRDLRDPHFSLMPDGRLMLTMGGSIYGDEKLVACFPQVAFSLDGIHWSSIQQISLTNEWIWRITWYQGVGYGFSYKLTNPSNKEEPWILSLYKTPDGLSYTLLKEFEIQNHPNEATLRFLEDGTMVALLRRRGTALIGVSHPPYTEWNWSELDRRIGGPNFLVLSDGRMIAAGRDYREDTDDKLDYTEGNTALGSMTLSVYTPQLYLPSEGDNSYPGMVYKDGLLYLSYYSSHSGKAAIYFAVVGVG